MSFIQAVLSEAAKQNGVILFGGTIPLKSTEPDKVLNTLTAYGRNGELIGTYDKSPAWHTSQTLRLR